MQRTEDRRLIRKINQGSLHRVVCPIDAFIVFQSIARAMKYRLPKQVAISKAIIDRILLVNWLRFGELVISNLQ
jgi:hypothetical protein